MEARSVTKSRLIGAVLIENGLITPEQLDLALDRQAKSGERLGEIVVAEFGVSRLDLAGVLAEQWSGLEVVPDEPLRTTPSADAFEPLTPDEVQIRRPIGEIFVELGFITAEQLEAALAKQGQSGGRIGEILVEQGSLTRLDLASALVEQWSALQNVRPPQAAMSGGSELPQEVVHLRRSDDDDEWSIDRAAVGALDERLRVVESTTSAAVTRADLDRAQIDLRAAIGAVESRIDAALDTSEGQDLADALRPLLARVDALEGAPVQQDLAALRAEIEDLRTHRIEAKRLAEVAEAVERLEHGTTRVEDIEALAAEIRALTARLDGLSDVGELRDRVDAAAAQTEAVENGLLELSSRLEPLGTLESRLGEAGAIVDRSEADELAGRIELLEEKNRQETEHLDRLAATLAAREDLAPALDVMRARLDELGLLVEQAVGVGVVDDLRARIEEISSSLEGRSLEEGIAPLVERLAAAESQLELMVETHGQQLEKLAGELGSRPGGEALSVEVEALREELGRVVAGVAGEKASLAEVLASRDSLEDELAGIRSRLDELAASPSEDPVLRERVEMMVSRLDELGRLEASVGSLREMVASVDTVRSADALAVGERLAGVESSLRSMAAMESSLREELTRASEEGAALLVERLAAAESQLELMVETHGQQLEKLAGELEERPSRDALAALDELRARIETLAERTSIDDLDRRISEVARRSAQIASDARAGIEGPLEELGTRVDGLSGTLDARIAELAGRISGLVAREDYDSATADHVRWLESELASIREAGDAHAASSQSALSDVEHRLKADVQDARVALDASLGAVRSEAHAESQELRLFVGAQETEQDEQRARLQRLDEEHAATVASVTRVEQMLADGLAALSARFNEELAAVRGEAEQGTHAVRGETASLGARVDEMLALRDADTRSSRAHAERSDERIEALVKTHESDLEGSRSALADLSDRFEGLSTELHERVAAVHAPVERLESKFAKLRKLCDEDSVAADAARAELEAKLDSLVSRCEAVGGAGVEARDELRGEIERLASSMGWRVEKIEEALATDDSEALRSAVGDLERRLEGQIAVGETQARATERALRKGLASLGERLVDTESAYVEAGTTFRRAIERLGAAVVEADARIADQIPALPHEGCVAFAPTSDGYRLVELPGAPPDVGSTVELESCDGPLVVTRYGISPLPLDRRPCAYLDHTEPQH